METDYNDVPVALRQSGVRNELLWKYRRQHFLAVTERSKEFLFVFFQFLLLAATVAYFGSHILLYLTGYYKVPITHINLHEIHNLTR